MPCLLFSSASVFFIHGVWGIFSFAQLNGFNLLDIALSNEEIMLNDWVETLWLGWLESQWKQQIDYCADVPALGTISS